MHADGNQSNVKPLMESDMHADRNQLIVETLNEE